MNVNSRLTTVLQMLLVITLKVALNVTVMQAIWTSLVMEHHVQVCNLTIMYVFSYI